MTTRKRIDKALERALSETIRAQKDPQPEWIVGEGVTPDLPV